MRDQILRSALSISSNIAEGSERGSDKDMTRFLHIAKGSAAELRTQLFLSAKMQLIQEDKITPLVQECRIISAQLQNLIKFLQAKP